MGQEEPMAGRAWVGPKDAGMDSFPEGWTEIGTVSPDDIVYRDGPRVLTDEQVYWNRDLYPLVSVVSVTMPLGPEFAELMQELLGEDELEEDE